MGRTTQRECGTAGRCRPDQERPAAWSAYGKLVRLFRERAGLTQQALADAIGYSMEQVASVEQGRRPAKAVFTEAAERVLDAGGALRVLQPDVDRAKLPLFFQDFALLEAEAVSRFSYDPMLVRIVNIRSDRDEVSEFWLRYGMLRSQALNSEESARLIERMAGEL
ncbi:helix-turn-helix domain-containing protein [Streptomyces griseoincarnatus]